MTDEEEIRQVMARYCFHVDRDESAPWVALFSDDASWQATDYGPFKGQAGIQKLASNLAKRHEASPVFRRHIISNEIISVDGDTARMRSYVTVILGDDRRISTVGDYEIELVKRGGQWRIHSLMFNNPAAKPRTP